VYVTVPDTEQAIAVFAALFVTGALGWPLAAARLGSSGAFAVAGLLAWTCAVGGVGRHTGVVGGVASLGLLATEPVSRLLARVRGPIVPRPGFLHAVFVGIAQVGAVFVASRVAGVRDSMAITVAVVTVLFVVCIVAGIAIALGTRRDVLRTSS
jgi:hypothetical protein